ncbi:MAG: protein translocase subunit SecF [Actinobacteria bacterium]|nr:protein translocase subunit SecF [Actinomycetota bacterium]
MAKFSGLGGRLYRGETSLNIIEARKKWYLLSAFFILISMASLGIKGLALGIEFKGGSSFSVTSQNRSIESARAAVAEAGYVGEPIVQTVGSEKIKIQTGVLDAAQSNAIQDSLAKTFGVTVESIDVQNIGPSWGEEISKKALQGLIAFLIIIMIYLALTFEPKMAIAAIVAVIHDVFITVGIYALVGFEVTPSTVIGFLTILNFYSGTDSCSVARERTGYQSAQSAGSSKGRRSYSNPFKESEEEVQKALK